MLRRRVAKLRGRSVAELYERGTQAIWANLEAWGLARTIREPSDAQLVALLDRSIIGEDSSPGALHRHFTTRDHPAFFVGVRDGSSGAALRAPQWRSALDGLIAAADRASAGRFDLLGYTDLSFGSPIDWHRDPVVGRRAPNLHWSRVPYLDADTVGDHKVIWELNRHQHFVVLGRAYQATRREQYAEAFVEQLSSWLDANPPKRGVNWASSLEVAFRAISWLWALELFRESRALTPDVLQRLLKQLYLHGVHIERYLSTYFSPNTHLTGEALGLFYLGLMLPELRQSSRWRARGWTILERELPRQVHEDGVYFEQATYYHRYTVDIYLHVVALAQHHDWPVPPAMLRRLDGAVAHLADLTQPDGTIPMIGDDDGGRLIALEERTPADVRSALGTAAVVLRRPELARVAGSVTQEVLWMVGPEGATAAAAALTAPAPSHLSAVYPVGGYAVMRDGWGRRANHAVIDSGPLGAMHCGHAHSDALSLTVSVQGCPLLIDPGTYTYTGDPAERDRFRHSAMHNTLTVDGQTASEPEGPFAWRSRADARLEEWWSGGLVDSFVGSHGGFLRLPQPALHRRRVLFARGLYWIIVDTVLSDGAHDATAHFHLVPGATVFPVGTHAAWIRTTCAAGPSSVFFAALGDVSTMQWEQEWVSPAYGVRALAPSARVVARGTGRQDLITVLVLADRDEPPVVRELLVDGGRAVLVDHPGMQDVVLLREDGIVQGAGMEMDAGAALIRRASPSGRIEAVALLDAGGRLAAGDQVFQSRGAAEMIRTVDGWTVTGDGRAELQ